MLRELTMKSNQREELIDITSRICDILSEAKVQNGVMHLFVPHTTAGITINENADPDVKTDILALLRDKFPQSDRYAHSEGNSDAHIKASVMGFSLQVLFEKRSLVLGRWQAIFFCEFDGPRTRKLLVKLVPHA